jgi:hypothetical protein
MNHHEPYLSAWVVAGPDREVFFQKNGAFASVSGRTSVILGDGSWTEALTFPVCANANGRRNEKARDFGRLFERSAHPGREKFLLFVYFTCVETADGVWGVYCIPERMAKI